MGRKQSNRRTTSRLLNVCSLPQKVADTREPRTRGWCSRETELKRDRACDLLYLYPVFGAPTAPRAFELLTRFKRSQFGTDLRQCVCISDSAAASLSFSITPFLHSIFLLS